MEMLRDMLLAMQEKGGAIKPTHLMYKANLSHESLKSYVAELKERGLITEHKEDNRSIYVITEKGYRFLEEYRKFSDFADAFGI